MLEQASIVSRQIIIDIFHATIFLPAAVLSWGGIHKLQKLTYCWESFTVQLQAKAPMLLTEFEFN